jgi:hypothetical protein
LAGVDPSALEGQRTGGVDAQYGDLAVAIKGLEVFGDGASVSFQPPKAGEEIVERDVVIARNNDFWRGQGVHKGARSADLFCARALGEVSGNGDQVGRDRRDRFDERLNRSVADTAEVKVGEMNELAPGGY